MILGLEKKKQKQKNKKQRQLEEQEEEKRKKNDFFYAEEPLKDYHIVAKVNAKSTRRKKKNMDQICIIEEVRPQTHILTLFDGHGSAGQSASVDVSSLFTKFIMREQRKIALMKQKIHFQEFVKDLYRQTEKELSKSLMSYDNSGTSAVTALIVQNHLFIANLGQAQAVLYRVPKSSMSKDGVDSLSLILTEHHIPLNQNENKRIKEKKARIYRDVDPKGNPFGPYKIWKDNGAAGPGCPVTRSFGDFGAKKLGCNSEPHTEYIQLSSEDQFLVIGSDGLFNLLTPSQVCGLVVKYMKKDEYEKKDGIDKYIQGYLERLLDKKLAYLQTLDKKERLLYEPQLLEDISFIILFFGFDEHTKLPFVKKNVFNMQNQNQKSLLKQNYNVLMRNKQNKIDLKITQSKPVPKEFQIFTKQIENLKGSQVLTILGGILAFGYGLMIVPVWAQTLNRCPAITPQEKDIINTLPTISGTVARVVLGYSISEQGGRLTSMILMSFSLLGLLLFMLVESQYNLETLNSESFGFYLLSLGGLCSGCAIANFQLLANSVFWSGVENSGWVQAIQAGTGNAFLGAYGLFLINFLEYYEIREGYYVTLGIYCLLSGCVYYLYRDPLNIQLQQQSVEENDAKIISEYYGQKNFTTKFTFFQTITDLNSIIFIINYFLCFGGFLSMSSFIKKVCVEYHKTTAYHGLTQQFLFSLLTSITRVFSGKISDIYGGYRITQISLISMIIGSIFLFFSKAESPYGMAHVTGLVFMMQGLGSMMASVYKWIVEIEYSQYITVATLAGAFGGSGTFLITMVFLNPISNSGEGNHVYAFLFFTVGGGLTFLLNLWFQKKKLKY